MGGISRKEIESHKIALDRIRRGKERTQKPYLGIEIGAVLFCFWSDGWPSSPFVSCGNNGNVNE